MGEPVQVGENNMSKEVMAVDFDDCIIPFDTPFRQWALTEHAIVLDKEKAVKGKFHYDEAYPESGLTSSLTGQLIDQYLAEASVETVPYDGVIEDLQMLIDFFDLQIVTARPPEHRDVTVASIERHIGAGVFSAVHTAEYNGDHKLTSKVSTYRRIDAKVAIDDADHNVNAAIEAGLIGISVQYPEHTHNGHNLHEDALVVASLKEIITLGTPRVVNGPR